MRCTNVATPLVWTALAVGACASPRSTIRFDGSPGVLPLVEELANAFRVRHPGIELLLASGLGSSARITAVAEGRIDVAMASHGVDSSQLASRALQAIEIARTAVVFAVNGTVPVRALSGSLVCEILSGRAANWNRYERGDLAIVPFMRPADEVDAEVAIAGVPCLKGLALGGAVRVIARPDSMAAALASTPGAFGVTSMTMVHASDGRIAPLTLDGVEPTAENVLNGRYPLFRRAWLITRAGPDPSVRRFLDFVSSPDGQAVIRASAAVPVATARFMQ